MNKGMWFASGFLFFGGLLLIAVSSVYTAYLKQKTTGRERVEAKVVDLVLKEGRNASGAAGDYRNVYFPVFEYFANGMLYKKTGKRGSYPSEYKVGQRLLIEYDLEDPNRYMITTADRKMLLWDLLKAAGIVMTACGVLIFIKFAVRH